MADDTYLIDSDAFIQAARHYYAFDLHTGFWDTLLLHAENGSVRSIDRVKQELERGKDELRDWANADFVDAFLSTNEDDVVDSYAHVMIWAQSQPQYFDAAKAEFARGADGWLVAFAAARQCVVVTQEQPAPDSRNSIKIPDVCNAFGVSWGNTFSMLRGLGGLTR